MDLTTATFWAFAAWAIASALLCITRRNPIASAMWLVSAMFALAGLFVLLHAQFIAAIQVLVYAGAVMVLFLFIIMLLDLRAGGRGRGGVLRALGGVALVSVLLVQLVGVVSRFEPGSVALAVAVGHAGLPRTSQFLLTFGGLALNVAVVGSIYRFMTSREMTWRMVWPGTLFTSVLYTILQFAGTNILTRRLAGATEVYGTFAALIVLAFWISLHGLIALVGAEINAAVQRRRHRVGPTASISTTAVMKQGPPDRVQEPSKT